MKSIKFDGELSVTHGAVQAALLIKGFDIKYLIVDPSMEIGDDTGYIVTISELNNEYYVHIVSTSMYSEIKLVILDTDDLVYFDENADLMGVDSYKKDFWKFNCLKDAVNFIRYLPDVMDSCEEDLEELDISSPIERARFVRKHPKSAKMLNAMSSIQFPYFDHKEKNRNSMRNIEKYKYDDYVTSNDNSMIYDPDADEPEEILLVCKDDYRK